VTCIHSPFLRFVLRLIAGSLGLPLTCFIALSYSTPPASFSSPNIIFGSDDHESLPALDSKADVVEHLEFLVGIRPSFDKPYNLFVDGELALVYPETHLDRLLTTTA